ncbi:unnamed protein product [Heligmosomoides polygyrus]|uniref:Uncharacterized protein n=1 Tax=Heligmosomoides polygyrus TaxID=6339 RepID=A0A183FPT6_HELPZ|nr:unnamed protein product [Heligmosomoides polygyrus]
MHEMAGRELENRTEFNIMVFIFILHLTSTLNTGRELSNTKPSTLEQKLRDLSLKYRQQEHSPERQQPDPPEKTSVAAKNR